MQTHTDFLFRIAIKNLVYKPGVSPLELITFETIRKLNQFVVSITQQVRKRIKNPKIIKILEFPVLFLGAKPQDTPAFYNFMNHIDILLYKPFLHLFIALIITLISSVNQRSFGHEISPAIAELSFKEDSVQIDITLSVELFLADIDASSVTDTNETEKSDIYDELRGRKGEEIKQLFTNKYSSFSDLITKFIFILNFHSKLLI